MCYEYLERAQEMLPDDNKVQRDLVRILGEELVHFGTLMDQLVFMECIE